MVDSSAMATQTFKSLYFSDFPGADAGRTLTLAIGASDAEFARTIQSLSSCELRTILGHESFEDVRSAAEGETSKVNAYCIRRLQTWYAARERLEGQPLLPLLEDSHIYATFRSGKTAPLHRWYPFLEGYSPEFVHQILDRFAPGASRIGDPFAGVGTTPIVAASRNLTAFYCELSPLLQFLIEAKLLGLTLRPKDRNRVVGALLELADNVNRRVSESSQDRRLARNYELTFGDSKFFDDPAFADVLRARSLLDQLAVESAALGRFATIAACAVLVPSSRLCRAGDLRFRRGSELGEIQDFRTAFQHQLQIVAEDLKDASTVDTVPVLVAGDAKRLEALPSLALDAVVTSPPYLNGTNYFRNSKIELWFLRSIRTGNDLRALRSLAVTAGINDVTRHKRGSDHDAVQAVVKELERKSYDARIPRMVGNYFHDMTTALRGVARHLNDGGLLALDIGDSMYAGVRVPTDDLIVKVAEAVGFRFEDRVMLRKRVSRDTSPLTQVLLLLRRAEQGQRSHMASRRALPSGPWRSQWEAFKRDLPHQRRPFSARNWGHPLHSLCSYQGKMKPSLAYHLVRTFVPTGGRLLDPFAGVGTIPFEAALQGVRAFGFDISPPALTIASAKLGRPNIPEVDTRVADLEQFIATEQPTKNEIANAAAIRFNSEPSDYFHGRTFKEVLLARRYFGMRPPASPSDHLVLACLLHVLHGNRPYALSRRSHPITPFAPTGASEYRPLLKHLRAKLARSLEQMLPATFMAGSVYDCDATSWWPREVDELDAVVTSPPFFDSTRFYLANWMRLWFTGWERGDFTTRPQYFIDERQKASFRVYESVFRQTRERLKPGGVVVLHLGRSAKCDMADQLAKIASPWFRTADRFVENVAHCESHGISDKGTVTAHQFLVLQ